MSASNSLMVAVISIIVTLFANIVIQRLRSRFEWFHASGIFQREHAYNQLQELYLEAYGIVSQSEFLKYYYGLHHSFSFMDLPFVEVQDKLTLQQCPVDNSIDFSSMAMVTCIMNNKQYASPKLLKLAVAYRFCEEQIQKVKKEEKIEYQKEQGQIMYELVRTVIQETNGKLKQCGMEFLETERSTGQMDYSIYKR